MESSEHNWANISETICCQFLASRPLGRCSFQNILTNPIISQINTLLLPYFISYYSSAFTINQFHNHDAEVYAPWSLVRRRTQNFTIIDQKKNRTLWPIYFFTKKKIEKFYTEFPDVVKFSLARSISQLLFRVRDRFAHQYSRRDVMSKRSIELSGIQFDL